MLGWLKAFVVFSLVFFRPLRFAQASIVGTVKDASGAVLPGVTVEASSPALIEKTRSVVTNGAGQYAIENLRPGTYTVTFTLTGFSTVKREGIELTGSFTATVNADMKVGRRRGNDHGHRRSAGRRRDERAQPGDDQRPDGQRNPDVSTCMASFIALVPAINVQGNDVGGARAASSTSSRSTADAGTKDRSWSTA